MSSHQHGEEMAMSAQGDGHSTDPEWNRRATIRKGLIVFAADVAHHWRASDYPADMQRSREQFRHAHTHTVKAIGKIAALIDHVDHDRLNDPEAQQLLDELPKLIADITRCAAKMAQVAPVPIDFADANWQRAQQLAQRWAAIRERQA